MGEERQEGRARWWERWGDEAERGRAVLGAEGEGGSCRCEFRKDGIRRRKERWTWRKAVRWGRRAGRERWSGRGGAVLVPRVRAAGAGGGEGRDGIGGGGTAG